MSSDGQTKHDASVASTCNQPLFLSKFLSDQRSPKDVLTASRVHLPGVDLVSYSGYVTVDETNDGHLFFWLVPATQAMNYRYVSGGELRARAPLRASRDLTISPHEKSPLLVYLNGGPGNSSLIGLFQEVGPLRVDMEGEVSERTVHWTNHFSVIFVDNPVGVGFSYCKPGGESTTMQAVSDNLYSFLTQFLQLYPQFHENDLYLGGLSYAGKYIPAFASKIHKEMRVADSSNSPSINLCGVYIGGGLCDPGKMLPMFPMFLTSMGMLSEQNGNDLVDRIEKAKDKCKQKTNCEEALLDIIDCVFGSTQKNLGYKEMDNLLTTKEYGWKFESYLNLPEVQHALHVRPTLYTKSTDKILLSMAQEFLNGVNDELTLLLENYKVLLFGGQMDMIVSPPMIERLLADLQWSGKDDYLKAEKLTWRDAQGEVAGYVTKVKNFTRIVMRLAGHRTAIDQPAWTLEMVHRFIHDIGFDSPWDVTR